MRYLGTKTKILEDIYDIIKKLNIETILDGFSGTASVANYLNKKNYIINTCDIQYYSYIIQFCKIKLINDKLQFNNLNGFNNKEEVLNYFNNLKEEELIIDGFIYNNYCSTPTKNKEYNRLFFSDFNGKLIDTIRLKIEEWYTKHFINKHEYFWLLGCLLESVSKVSNTTGVYSAYLKKLNGNSIKQLKLKNYFDLNDNNKKNDCYIMDTFKLISKVEYDLCYFDPPYNGRQYCDNYHLLETISLYDNPIIKGKAGKRDTSNQKSNFCKKKMVKKEWLKYIKNCNSKYQLWSYSSDSFISKKELINIIKNVNTLELVSFTEIKHKKYISNNKTKKNKVTEYLILIKKKQNILNLYNIIYNKLSSNDYKYINLNNNEKKNKKYDFHNETIKNILYTWDDIYNIKNNNFYYLLKPNDINIKLILNNFNTNNYNKIFEIYHKFKFLKY